MKEESLETRILLTIISIVVGAVAYNLFLLPLNIVPGGTSGIATVLHYMNNWNPAIVVFVIASTCCILSFIFLGKKRTTGTLIACICYPLMIELTSTIRDVVPVESSDLFLYVLIASILGGISNGLMYKSGYSSGGLPIISQILYEKFHISVAKSSLIINSIIVLIGAKTFGLTKALYAIIYLHINSLVIDKVLLGISNNKALYIITDEEEEVKDFILKEMHHSTTVFSVKGGLKEDKRKAILTVIPTREYHRLTEEIKKIDNSAFFVTTDAYEVNGAK